MEAAIWVTVGIVIAIAAMLLIADHLKDQD